MSGEVKSDEGDDTFLKLFKKEIHNVNPVNAKKAKDSYDGEEARASKDAIVPQPGSVVDTKH